MAAQVEVQPGEVGRTGVGGRLHLSPLVDSSNKSLVEGPSGPQGSLFISPEPSKPVPGPKPRLTPKPFSVDRNPTVRPILAPKPRTKPQPELTRPTSYKPDPPVVPKPEQPGVTGKQRPVSTNPGRPVPTSFKPSPKLSTGQTSKPVAQPFKPAPPLTLGDPSKPAPSQPAGSHNADASGSSYSRGYKKPQSAEWSGSTKQDMERVKTTSSARPGGTSMTRAKSMGFLNQIEQEEEERKLEVASEAEVALRPHPRSSRPRPVSAIFLPSPTETEVPGPASQWSVRRPLSADLTSRFESIGLSLHRRPTNTDSKENTPEEGVPLRRREKGSEGAGGAAQGLEGKPKPSISRRGSDKVKEEGDEEKEEVRSSGGSIKRRISLLLDSSSSASPGGRAIDQAPEPRSPVQPIPEAEAPLGVKQRIKQLTEDTPPAQTPAPKLSLKPRPLPLDLTKRFTSDLSEGTDRLESDIDPQRRGEDSASFRDQGKGEEETRGPPEPASDPASDPAPGRLMEGGAQESSLSGGIQTVRAALFENVVERHSVLVLDEDQGRGQALPRRSLSLRRQEEEEGSLVTATYRQPASPSSPLRVEHSFDTVPAVGGSRVVSESVPSAQLEDKALTLRRRSDRLPARAELAEHQPPQGQEEVFTPASGAGGEQQPRFLRVGALHKWNSTDLEKEAEEEERRRRGKLERQAGKGGEPEEERQMQREVERQTEVDRERRREKEREEVAAPKRLKMLEANEQLAKPRATYFALTGQAQEVVFQGEERAERGDLEVPFDDFSVKTGQWGSQGKVVPLRRTIPLDDSLGKSLQSKVQDEERLARSPTQERQRGTAWGKQGRMEDMDIEKQRQMDLEKQRALDMEAQRQVEFAQKLEREKQIELEKERQKELEGQRQREMARDRQRALERQQELERERQRELERERKRELERERQQELERERQRELERERQQELERELERERQKELERERQKELEREREKQRELERERQKELERERQRELERERQRELERERQRELERERQRELEREKHRELEREKQRELERERQRELEREKQRELERERQRELERERELERQRELERERQRELERQKEMDRQRLEKQEMEKERQELAMQRELERAKEQERRQLQEYEKQKQAERERQQLLEAEKQRLREKMEREEAEKMRQLAIQQEVDRQRELERERERQEREKERLRQLEVERQRQRDLERQRQLDLERQELDKQAARQRESERERRLAEELERRKEAAAQRQEVLNMETKRLLEKMERDEAENVRRVAAQQEVERQRMRDKQKREEQERAADSSPLRPKVLDIDSVTRDDQFSPNAPYSSDPSSRWRKPSPKSEEPDYRPGILDIDSFRPQVQGVPEGVVGRPSPLWTSSQQDPWERRQGEVVESVLAGPEAPRKPANKPSLEQLLLRQEERASASCLVPERRRTTMLCEPQLSTLNPMKDTSLSGPPAQRGLDPWSSLEAGPHGLGGMEARSQRRSQGSQELNRMRSRSVSRRSTPASSTLEGSLFRVRSRSAHRERGDQGWESQKQGAGSDEEGKDTDTLVHDTDSQYGTWETGLRTDDSLTPATPTSEGNLSPSPGKPTPPHTPGEQAPPSDLDTLDGPSLLQPEPLPFPETSTSLLDSSALRSRAQLGKKRAPRSRPSRASRQSAGLAGLAEGQAGPAVDWRSRDSTEEKVQPQQEDSDSEEQARAADPRPAASQPQRVPIFPGMDPLALMAQLKKRGDSDSQSDGLASSPSQLSRSPKSPFLPRATRLLPPAGGKENGEEASPQWLRELKSKKRLSQYENDS